MRPTRSPTSRAPGARSTSRPRASTSSRSPPAAATSGSRARAWPRPHVTGVAALIRAARPGLDVEEVEAVLRASAVDLGAPGHDITYGDGLVDAAAALDASPSRTRSRTSTRRRPCRRSPSRSSRRPARSARPARRTRSSSRSRATSPTRSRSSRPGTSRTASARPRGSRSCTRSRSARRSSSTNLKAGRCYQVYVAVIDEEFNYAEALSPMIRILDLTAPVDRAPHPGGRERARRPLDHGPRRGSRSRSWSRASDVKVREGGQRPGGPGEVPLGQGDQHAGRGPGHGALAAHTRYRVEVGSGVVDRGGNHLAPVHWTFVTGS